MYIESCHLEKTVRAKDCHFHRPLLLEVCARLNTAVLVIAVIDVTVGIFELLPAESASVFCLR